MIYTNDHTLDITLRHGFKTVPALSKALKESFETAKEIGSLEAYRIHLKMDFAKTALEDLSMDTEKLGETLGFKDEAAFNDYFNENAGMPPNEYRMRNASTQEEVQIRVPRMMVSLVARVA